MSTILNTHENPYHNNTQGILYEKNVNIYIITRLHARVRLNSEPSKWSSYTINTSKFIIYDTLLDKKWLMLLIYYISNRINLSSFQSIGLAVHPICSWVLIFN